MSTLSLFIRVKRIFLIELPPGGCITIALLIRSGGPNAVVLEAAHLSFTSLQQIPLAIDAYLFKLSSQ